MAATMTRAELAAEAKRLVRQSADSSDGFAAGKFALQAFAVIDQLAADQVKPTTNDLLARAVDLHDKAGMPWSQAEELALEEVGFTDDDLHELIGESVSGGVTALLHTPDDIEKFARAILVHGYHWWGGKADLPAAPASSPSPMGEGATSAASRGE